MISAKIEFEKNPNSYRDIQEFTIEFLKLFDNIADDVPKKSLGGFCRIYYKKFRVL